MCQSNGRAATFPSNKELLAHVLSAHQRRICTICLQVDQGSIPRWSCRHAMPQEAATCAHRAGEAISLPDAACSEVQPVLLSVTFAVRASSSPRFVHMCRSIEHSPWSSRHGRRPSCLHTLPAIRRASSVTTAATAARHCGSTAPTSCSSICSGNTSAATCACDVAATSTTSPMRSRSSAT